MGSDSSANNLKEHEWFSFEPGQLGIGVHSVTLKVEREVVKADVGSITGRMRYSLDNGVFWTTIFTVDASRSQQIDTVSLGAIDISKLRVDARADWNSGVLTTVAVSVFEIWIELSNLGA